MEICFEFFFYFSFKVIGFVVEYYFVCFFFRIIYLDEDIGISFGF